MSGGIMLVVEAIRAIGPAAVMSAASAKKAADSIERDMSRASETASNIAPAGSASTGGMGAGSGSGGGNATMTTRGLATAISIARRSL